MKKIFFLIPFILFAQSKPKVDTIKFTKKKGETFKIIKNKKIKIYL